MKRVMLTGATGFVGRHAIAPLLAAGYEVHAVSSREVPAAGDVRWHRVDLLDSEQVVRAMEKMRPTHLLHFAWYAEPGRFWRSPENFRWLEASLALLRHFRQAGGARVVMAGTCAEYDWEYGYCSEHATPACPATPYGVCKHALQETLAAWGDVAGLSQAWGRIFFMYGPHEHPARLVASIIGSLLRGEEARCTAGDQIRDYMHVEDVAAAFAALLDGAVQGTVNIASGRPVAVKDVVLAAADCLGARERVRFGALPKAENDPPLLLADIRRLTEEVGWHAQRELGAGMAQTVDWWRLQFKQGHSS
jgi:nucleoside-diphosphate-sugar epimerase